MPDRNKAPLDQLEGGLARMSPLNDEARRVCGATGLQGEHNENESPNRNRAHNRNSSATSIDSERNMVSETEQTEMDSEEEKDNEV